jgi:hypothetical protein
MKTIGWISFAKFLATTGLIILIASLLWIIFDDNYFRFFKRIDSKTASELGDFISGFVGIFWTAAGVILIYATFAKQSELNDKQQFETTFFNLLNTYHNLIQNTKDSVDIYNDFKKQEYSGRAFISAVLSEIKTGLDSRPFSQHICKNATIPEINLFLNRHGKTKENMDYVPKPEWQIETEMLFLKTTNLSKEFILAQYDFFYNRHQAQLGHIFRFLFNIFKFTIQEREKYGDHKRYIDLIQAQLSSDELSLLFYNALSNNAKSSEGELKFFNWLDEYNFFENIDKNSLIKEDHNKYYPKTKFKFLKKQNNTN